MYMYANNTRIEMVVNVANAFLMS